MGTDRMASLCVDWASTVDDIEHTSDVQNAALVLLFDMMNSPHWRLHIVSDKWNLLEYFTEVPGNSVSEASGQPKVDRCPLRGQKFDRYRLLVDDFVVEL